MPKWVEDNGGSGNSKGFSFGGWPLYLTTYLTSIVVGNRVIDYFGVGKGMGGGLARMCLGASGGICGLNGLRLGMLRRMNNGIESTKVFKDMLILLVMGSMLNGVSNAAHIGGFLCGLTMATLFGPTYGRDVDGAKLTAIGDDVPVEYRRVMGGGNAPGKGYVPLRYFWMGLGLWFVYRREVLGLIPAAVWMGIREPGVLSGIVTAVI